MEIKKITSLVFLFFAIVIGAFFIFYKINFEDKIEQEESDKMFYKINDSYYKIRPEGLANILDVSGAYLSSKEDEATNELIVFMNKRIDKIFDKAVAKAPDYSDWYFSFSGKTARAASYLSLKNLKDPKEFFFNGDEFDKLSDSFGEKYIEIENNLKDEWLDYIDNLMSYKASDKDKKDIESPISVNLSKIYDEFLEDDMLNGGQVIKETAQNGGSILSLTSLALSGIANGKNLNPKNIMPQLTKPKPNSASKGGLLRSVGIIAVSYTPSFVKQSALKVKNMGSFVYEKAKIKTTINKASKNVKPASKTIIKMGKSAGLAGLALTAGSYIMSINYSKYDNKKDLENEITNRLNKMREDIKYEYKEYIKTIIAKNNEDLIDRTKASTRPIDQI